MTQLSRRKLLKSAGAASVAGAVVLGSNWKANAQTAQDTAEQLPSTKKVLERHEDYQVFLSSGDVVVGFDKRYGTVSSITRKSDPYSLNYISNAKNTPAEDGKGGWKGAHQRSLAEARMNPAQGSARR